MKISQKVINIRLLAIIILVTFLFSILICRLFYVQVIDSSNLVQKAYSQWVRDLAFTANRGYILDTNGVVLASSTTTFTLYARPNEIKSPIDIFNEISDVLDMDKELLLKKLSKTGVSEIRIATKLSKNQMLKLVEKNIDGLYLTADSQRVYPYGKFLTQLLGFTSSDNSGQNGLELLYNSYLLGVNGASLTNSDLIGNKLSNKSTTYLKSTDGMTLNLTIDYYLQSFVEKAVNDALIQYNAKSCSCIMMKANSGEILAISTGPTYDLNNIPRDNIEDLNAQSRLIVLSDVYEPGSTFKIITSAIGLEENKIKKSYYCPGYCIVDGQRIRCWRSIGHGSQDFPTGICNSCNCVFMDIALSCGKSTMYSYYEKFGLTKKTGISFPGESNSIMIKQDKVLNVDLARMGFGQAIAITPIQLINSVCSVLNGGNLYVPYVVKNIVDPATNLIAHSTNKTIKNTTISNNTSELMKEYLINVVEHGSGKNAKIEGYLIGGKTGTSQKYENGAIASGKYVSSFIGFTEINGEIIVCLFLVDEPKGYAYYGSIVAAPYVGEIFKRSYQYYGIPPQHETNIEEFEMPDLLGMKMADAIASIKVLELDYEHTGDSGNVIHQIPAPGSKINKNTIVLLVME